MTCTWVLISSSPGAIPPLPAPLTSGEESVVILIDAALAGEWETWFGALKQLVLPATTLALFTLAPIARMTRAAMLTALSSDYIRTARAALH